MVSVAFIEKPGEQLFWVSALDRRGLVVYPEWGAAHSLRSGFL